MGFITPRLVGRVYSPKRAHRARNLHIRTLDAMAKARPSRPRPLMLRFLSGPVRALFPKRAHRARNLHIRTLNAMAKALPSHPRPLMLRFLSGPVRALDILSENTDNEKVKM
ncbi:hypothetical protein CCE29_00380 [Lacticaseibacillus rhamnosus]|nr:hypothetical protein B4583_04380 [Lacticaseibacillus rhamnosus]ART94567.1 hypothetical protein CCE29_00380 [Lacticaseibacillus rhamnosus]CAR87200.1 Putative protein without homology [Lacticaseibacillus rhamnosus GG]